MSDFANLVAQLAGSNPQPAPDPAVAAVKLARATLDALVLKLGQTIEARVVGELAVGLTQFAAGNESFVLKLQTPLPAGTQVTIKVAPSPQGAPTVTVSVPPAASHPPANPPLAQLAALVVPRLSLDAPTLPVVPRATPQATQFPLDAQAPQPLDAPPRPVPLPATARPVIAQPAPAPGMALGVAVASPQADTGAVASPRPAATPMPTPGASPVVTEAETGILPTSGQPAAQSRLPVTLQQAAIPVTPANMAPPATPPVAVPQPAVSMVPSLPPVMNSGPPPVVAAALESVPQAVVAAAPSSRPDASVQPAGIPATVSVSPPAGQQPPVSLRPSSLGADAKPAATPAAAQQLPLPTARPAAETPRPVAPPLNLADPAQAAARQDSAAPLLARLAAIVTAAAPSMPRPILEVAQKVLAGRLDLNRGAPEAKALETAVLKAGVLLAPLAREASVDGRTALLALRSTLLAFLGGNSVAPVASVARPAPPLKGEAPRAPPPQGPIVDQPVDGPEALRALLGHTDAALSRLKLLQSASQPADTRPDAPAARNELRIEIPMLLGAETGILQLLVERDGRQKREPERQRGWRMRFAMNFTRTGEVGADISLLGRTASIAIWASDPEIADALDDMLPELAPAIQRHGLELTSLRVRRGIPQSARPAPGQLLDSAR